jgi:hypothetical protein
VAARLIDAARREGLRGLWWRTLSATVYRRLVVAAREIDQGPPPARARLALEFEYLTLDGLGEYMRLRPDANAAEVERRLRAGRRCALARHRGEIVSVRWLSTDVAEIDYLGLAFEVPPGVLYLYDYYTSPSARRHGIAAARWSILHEEYRRARVRRLIGAIMPENTGGRGAVSSAAYRTVGTVGCVRLPGVRIPVRHLRPGYLGPSSRFRPAPGGRPSA